MISQIYTMSMLSHARVCWQSAAALRCYSSAGSLADQVIAYARSLQGQEDQAVDVLRSGLGAVQQRGGDGQERARLLLALSEVASRRSDWEDAAASAGKARTALADGNAGEETPLGLLAALMQARSLLAAGWDDDVRQVAAWAGGSDAASPISLAVLTALGQWTGAHEAAARTQGELGKEGVGSAQGHNLMIPFAAKALADFNLSQGAGKLYARAASGAAQAAEAAGILPGPASPALALELEADAHMGTAQVAIASRQWDAAEEALSSALRAAEGAAGDAAPMLAAPLMLLGWVYSRSARVTYGEGLYREAAKLARLDPARDASSSSSTLGVRTRTALHESLAAALAWRYSQLLTALPNRSSEAAAWAGLAHAYWERGCSMFHADGHGGTNIQIDRVLGDSNCLTGKGSHGSGAIVSLMMRRLLPISQ